MVQGGENEIRSYGSRQQRRGSDGKLLLDIFHALAVGASFSVRDFASLFLDST